MDETIYDLIESEQTAYQTLPVAVIEDYEWQMAEHIKKTVLYKNSQYLTGKNDNKPYKNIIRPILNLAYRAEGFDVKDIQLFVDDAKDYYKSFLIKKYHEKWARDNSIDTFIDELVETYVDFGGVLVKDVNQERPEVVPWPTIAFCDQTDFLSGPFAIRHQYNPDQLKEMEPKGWKSIDELIVLSQNQKSEVNAGEKKTKTPGKYIEVFEVHGIFKKAWLKTGENFNESYEGEDDQDYVNQIHIVAFYKTIEGKNEGITLFNGIEKELGFKLLLRDKVHGRALGFGGAEELFEPQVWINWNAIHVNGLLEAASKQIYKTTDQTFLNKNKTKNLKNGDTVVIELGSDIGQLNTQPVNVVAFENSTNEWENHARQMGAANEAIMGESPSAGTPFALQQLVSAESHSLHEYRKGKIATFVDEIYRDWVVPHISKSVTEGQEFLSELDLEEMQQVAESLVTCETNDAIRELIMKGKVVTPDQVEVYKTLVRDRFMKGGSKKFIKILKDEMKEAPIAVRTNIVGKQKNLAAQVDKLTNVFRQIIAAPQVLDDPRMAKIFNQILESSGFSPIDFTSGPKPVSAPVPGADIAQGMAPAAPMMSPLTPKQ